MQPAGLPPSVCLRPFIMVIVEIENDLYDIMYRPALESVEKEAKFLLRPEMDRKWASISDRTLLVHGKEKIRRCALLTSKDGAQEP